MSFCIISAHIKIFIYSYTGIFTCRVTGNSINHNLLKYLDILNIEDRDLIQYLASTGQQTVKFLIRMLIEGRSSMIWVCTIFPKHLMINLIMKLQYKTHHRKSWYMHKHIVMIQSFLTNRSRQTVQTQIRLLLEEQSDQGPHCLLFHLHHFDITPSGLASLFEF